MKKSSKFAFRCGITLMAIAGVSAILIGVISSFTSPIIEKNALQKEKDGLAKVFAGEYKEIKENVSVGKNGIESYYPVILKDDSDARIYKASGRNGFGEVSFLLGLYEAGEFAALGSMVILSNTESYGTTLEENYIGPYQKCTNPVDRQQALSEIKCGATFGATLIRDLAYECQNHYAEDLK